MSAIGDQWFKCAGQNKLSELVNGRRIPLKASGKTKRIGKAKGKS
jgi:hypothetical protein